MFFKIRYFRLEEATPCDPVVFFRLFRKGMTCLFIVCLCSALINLDRCLINSSRTQIWFSCSCSEQKAASPLWGNKMHILWHAIPVSICLTPNLTVTSLSSVCSFFSFMFYFMTSLHHFLFFVHALCSLDYIVGFFLDCPFFSSLNDPHPFYFSWFIFNRSLSKPRMLATTLPRYLKYTVLILSICDT